MCAVICDGVPEADGTVGITLSGNNNVKRDYFLDLLADAGIAAIGYKKKTPSEENFETIYFEPPRPIKRGFFDSYWYQCSQHQLELITNEILRWSWNKQ